MTRQKVVYVGKGWQKRTFIYKKTAECFEIVLGLICTILDIDHKMIILKYISIVKDKMIVHKYSKSNSVL